MWLLHMWLSHPCAYCSMSLRVVAGVDGRLWLHVPCGFFVPREFHHIIWHTQTYVSIDWMSDVENTNIEHGVTEHRMDSYTVDQIVWKMYVRTYMCYIGQHRCLIRNCNRISILLLTYPHHSAFHVLLYVVYRLSGANHSMVVVCVYHCNGVTQ